MDLLRILLILSGVSVSMSIIVEEGMSTFLSCEYNLEPGTSIFSLEWKFKSNDSADGKKVWTYTEGGTDQKTDINMNLKRAYPDVPIYMSHSIELSDISLREDGLFTCSGISMSFENINPVTISVFVIVQPQAELKFIDPEAWEENRPAYIDCEIPKVRPMLDKVYVEGHDSITPDHDFKQTLNSDGKTYNILQRSVGTFKWNDGGKTKLRCSAQWNGMTVSSPWKPVESIKYSPKQSEYHPDHVYGTKGEPFDLKFHFFSNPAPQSLDTSCNPQSTSEPHLYVITIHFEKLEEEDFRTHECIVGNEVGDSEVVVVLGNLTTRQAGLAVAIVISLLLAVVVIGIVGYVIWKKRKARKPVESGRVSYTKELEQNGNYEPYCELADERKNKRVTPQRPIPVGQPQATEEELYEEVNTNLKEEDNPKHTGTIYSDVAVKKLPAGKKPFVQNSIPGTVYTPVQFNDKQQKKQEDTDSD